MPALAIYDRLCNVKLLSRSYSLKFLFIAFLGIHIPLIGIIFFLLMGPANLEPLRVFLIVLALTLVATVLTLYLLNELLIPLSRTKQALELYLDQQQLPQLPLKYKDEAGILMNKVQTSLLALDTMLQEKKDLASLISHDLKQPLSLIGTTAEAIALTTEPAQLQRFSSELKKMAKEQIQMLEGVLQLLNYDDLLSQREKLTQVPVDLLMEDIIQSMSMKAELKNIAIILDSSYDGLAQVHYDLFPQVVKNVLHNAIKFSYPYSEVVVAIKQEAEWLSIAVTDKGKGFTVEQGNHLFDRFTKASQKGTEGEASTGIGLHICQKIMKLHGGRIDAYSAGKDQGATFTIVLPNNKAAESHASDSKEYTLAV